MGFNRRELEDQRREAAEKEAATRREIERAQHPRGAAMTNRRIKAPCFDCAVDTLATGGDWYMVHNRP